MKAILKYILFILLFGFLSMCDEDEVTSRDYPRINTLSVTEISSEGARFNAEIIFRGESKVINYGFVWGESENPDIISSDRIIYSENIKTDKFFANISTALEEGLIYFVRSFIETGDYTVYGENVSFISLGSKAPEISSFWPVEGTIGDTISIIGHNFSFIISQNKVMFDKLESNIISATDTILKVVVPEDLTNLESEISVSVFGNKNLISVKFKLSSPSINTFSPIIGTDNTEVSIFGEGFTTIADLNIVKFGPIVAEVISASKNQLKVIIPVGLLTKENELSLSVANQISIANEPFVRFGPIITDFQPKEASIRERISIEGNYFSTSIEGNRVYFDTVQALVTNVSATSLEVEVPFGVPIDAKIKIVTASQEAITSTSFQILLPDLLSLNLNKANRSSEIILSGENFSPKDGDNTIYFGGVEASILAQSKNSITVEVPNEIDQRSIEVYVNTGGHSTNTILFEFIGGSWTQGSTFPGLQRLAPAYFQIDDKFYVGLGASGSLMCTDIWEFDPITEIWTQKSDFPGSPRVFSTSFVVNGKGYIGLGALSRAENTFLDDFWEYDPSADTWTQVANFPGEPRLRATSFVDDGRGIVGLGHSRTDVDFTWTSINYKDFFTYDPSNNSWSSMPDFPAEARFSPTKFKIDLNVYIGTGATGGYFVHSSDKLTDFWKYDLINKTWTQVADFPDADRLYTTSFSLNGRGYIGLGDSYVPNQLLSQSSFYEYDPMVNEWTETEFNPYGAGDFPINFEFSSKAYLLFIERIGVASSSKTFEIFEPYD